MSHIARRHYLRTAVILAVLLVLPIAITPVLAVQDSVTRWNILAVAGTITAGEGAVPQSRTLAVVQVAVHDALNAIDRRYQPYAYTGIAEDDASPDAAVATAAHDALVGIISVGASLPGFGSPAQQANAVAAADAAYAADLAAIPDGLPKTHGIAVGQAAASAILALRSSDHATVFVPYTPGTLPGQWRPTPNPVPFDPPAAADHLPAALPGWGLVTPFVLRTSEQFLPDGPPALTSEAYANDYNEVKAIGSKLSGLRTADQTMLARFWYEPSASMWSRIARVTAEANGLDSWERARLLALVNLAMADGFIAGFETKYLYNFWRPITAIRAGDTDGNDATVADPAWESLLNTPMIPDYTSTHSVLGGAAAAVLQEFFGTDYVSFSVTSGAPFAGLTRSFFSFSEAAQENADSRVYAGIHFRTACRDGVRQGRHIGQFAIQHYLLPVKH